MGSTKRVFSKIANIQKKHSKVNLSAFDDLDKRLKEFKDQNSLISDLIEEVAKRKRDFSSDFQNLSDEYKSLSADYENLFSKAADVVGVVNTMINSSRVEIVTLTFINTAFSYSFYLAYYLPSPNPIGYAVCLRS